MQVIAPLVVVALLGSTALAQAQSSGSLVSGLASGRARSSGSSSSVVVIGGNDNCATPDVIVGTGTFAVSTVGATDSLLPPGCGGPALNDVWFSWTAPASGEARISTCGGVSADTVVAVWSGSGCPVGLPIVCNDDSCGLRSNVAFQVTSGANYMLQFFGFNGVAYAGNFTLGVAVADDCAAPSVIAGAGTFAFDTALATTGGTPLACVAAVPDVWSRWTATQTGTATVSTCGMSANTAITAWSGSGCPSGAPVACNDDAGGSCGLASRISFSVTNGETYMLQFSDIGATSPAGTFTIAFSNNDDCAAPFVIAGPGTFAVTTVGATNSGAPAACSTAARDVWFRWTANTAGTATVSTCGGVSANSVIAAWPGAGCPTGTPLACNNDAGGTCGSQSTISFPIRCGEDYMLQFFAVGPTATYSGTFTIAVNGPSFGCTIHDDGVSESAFGAVTNANIVWLNRLGGLGQTTLVGALRVAYGTPAYPGTSSPAGTPVTIAIWDDPNDDGNPNDLVLLRTATSSVQNPETNILNVVPFGLPVIVNGYYFVGVAATVPAYDYPAALDLSVASLGRAWTVSNAGSIDLANLAATPPIENDAQGFGGVWLLRADCCTAAGTSYCAGTAATCPCANGGAPLQGCANSVFAAGGSLSATGIARVAYDTLLLSGTNMPPSTVLYFQGTANSTSVFGDGRRCATGSVFRLGTKTNSAAGTSTYPDGDEIVSVRGAIPAAGGVRFYQCWYRNAAAFCTTSTFNLSNGVSVLWSP